MRLKAPKHLRVKLSLLAFFVVSTFLLAPGASADVGDALGSAIGWIIGILISALGLILILVIKGLLLIASYQNFIGSPAVSEGWVIVRDISNMFFVVILLFIAFSTILHQEEYSYKKWLPKLILMAVLINFSKTICGLLIDVSQIVMLTFVNAFKDVAGGNIIDMLGIKSIVTMAKNTQNVGFWTIIGAYVLGLIYMIIALVVITTMMMMLAMRLVMIWIYVVLSPLAYLLSAFPGGAQYASQWWKEFIQNLVVGPVIAFFIWLSFAALQTGTNLDLVQQAADSQDSLQSDVAAVGDNGDSGSPFATEAATPAALIKFVIGIGMLIGGLKIAQQIGGAAGSVAGDGMAALNKGKAMAGSATKWAGRTLGHNLADVRDYASDKIGIDLNLVAANKRRQEQVASNRQLRKDSIRFNTINKAEDPKAGWLHRKAALFSTGDVGWQNFVEHKFLRGGSIKKEKKYGEEMNKDKDNIKLIDQDINSLENDKSRVVTQQEDNDNKARIKNLDNKRIDLQLEIDILKEPPFADLEKKEKDGSITEREQNELDGRRDDIRAREQQIGGHDEEINDLMRKDRVVADQTEKDEVYTTIQNQIEAKNQDKKVITDHQVKTKDKIRENKLSESSTARANIKSRLEGEASKNIAGISNSSELAAVFREALKNNDYGMMAAVTKKMAKTGNYNDLQGDLGLGTGLDGMLGLAKVMQDKGGMSEQDSFGILAELGEITKAGKHYQAFGTVSMDDTGKWQANDYTEQQAAILSEQSKVQTQSFSRDANRLGLGHYKEGAHTAANWVLDDATIKLFASKDNDYAKQIGTTGNVNLIRFIASNSKNLELLEKNGAKEVAAKIREIAGSSKTPSAENPKAAIKSVIH